MSGVVEACRAGDLDRLRGLVLGGASVWPVAGQEIPLLVAIEADALTCVEFILDQGFPLANVGPDSARYVALEWAKALPMIDFLLERGAKPDLVERCDEDVVSRGKSLAHDELGLIVYYVRHEPETTRQLLLDAVFNERVFIRSLGYPASELAVLIELGADVTSSIDAAGPSMWLACFSSQANEDEERAVFELLLANGADLQERRNGRTLLHEACGGDGPDAYTVRWLLEHGLDPNAQDDRGRTPMDILLWRYYWFDALCAQHLIDAGACIEATLPRARRAVADALGGDKPNRKIAVAICSTFGLDLPEG